MKIEVKVINLGKVNNVAILAVNTSNGFAPLSEADSEFCSPDVVITCDSGVYPGLVDFEQYICDKAYKEVTENHE